MPRAYAINFLGQWDGFFPLAKFSYSKRYESSNEMAPFRLYMVGDDVPPLGGLSPVRLGYMSLIY